MRILIVKLSSLGDVVHAMPAVQDIRKAYPEAQIDWVVEPAFAPLLARCGGVNRVIPCAIRRWRKTPFATQTRAQWRAFKSQLQAEAYDAVIDLQGLAKSALVAWLAKTTPAGKRYALANKTDGSGYEAPTRWVADVAIAIAPHTHAQARSRLLCAQALGYVLPDSESFGLAGLADSAQAAPDLIAPLSTGKTRPAVALVHGTSRADKEWPVDCWLDIARRLDGAGYDVALIHGTDAEQQRSQSMAAQLSHAHVWPRLSLDALTDALSHCAGVIGVDSGISHMAVALDLPHVQLYNFDTAWRTGPVNRTRQRCVFAQPYPSIDTVWQAWLEVSAA